MSAYITAIGVALPNKPVSSKQIESVLGLVDDTPSTVKDVILSRNGIKWRYYAIDPQTGRQTHNNAQLTAEAVQKLTQDGFQLDDCDVLACGTSSADQFIPGHASMVHGELKCRPCEVITTSGVCCSGMSAMKYAYMSVLSGGPKHAIATGSEIASSSFRPRNFKPQRTKDTEDTPYIAFNQEFLRFMLSDGAGSVRVSDKPNRDGLSLRIDWIDMFSFANQVEACMYAGATKREDGSLIGWREEENVEAVLKRGGFNLTQDVNVLAAHIVNLAVNGAFRTVLERRNLRGDDIDWVLPHLSSMFFKDPVRDAMSETGFSVPEDRWFTNLSYKGNTGSASIYIMLEELWNSGKLKPKQRILCAVPESARFTYAYMHLTVE